MEITLVHLYPDLLNIYGDSGNVAALTWRCQKRGIKLNYRLITINQPLKTGSFDLVFSGGGQDQQQAAVSRDLITKSRVLKQAVSAGIPMLTICGSYQLFGRYFQPASGPKIPGIGIFPAVTIASKKRKIGNILIESSIGQLVGFENHSGNTWLDQPSLSLGRVIRGFGNNGQDKTEGCRINNAIGCYLHGPLLPKNPYLTDYLISSALNAQTGHLIKLKPLPDKLEWRAHCSAVKIVTKPGWRNW